MPELGTYGSVRGASSNGRPYRDHSQPSSNVAFRTVVTIGADLSTGGVAHATQTPTVVKSSLRRGACGGFAGCRLGGRRSPCLRT